MNGSIKYQYWQTNYNGLKRQIIAKFYLVLVYQAMIDSTLFKHWFEKMHTTFKTVWLREKSPKKSAKRNKNENHNRY